MWDASSDVKNCDKVVEHQSDKKNRSTSTLNKMVRTESIVGETNTADYWQKRCWSYWKTNPICMYMWSV